MQYLAVFDCVSYTFMSYSDVFTLYETGLYQKNAVR